MIRAQKGTHDGKVMGRDFFLTEIIAIVMIAEEGSLF